MIETGTGAGRIQVSCLTPLDEGMIEVRLHAAPGTRRVAVLAEPSALQYARFRVRFIGADTEIADKFAEPERPVDRLDGESDWDRAVRHADHQKAVAQWLDDRTNYRLDENHAPYAHALIEAINELAGVEITLADLTPEGFKAPTLQALLEAWEAPLGGEGFLPVRMPGIHEETVAPSDQPSPDSPESTPSSPPGGESSPNTPPPS